MATSCLSRRQTIGSAGLLPLCRSWQRSGSISIGRTRPGPRYFFPIVIMAMPLAGWGLLQISATWPIASADTFAPDGLAGRVPRRWRLLLLVNLSVAWGDDFRGRAATVDLGHWVQHTTGRTATARAGRNHASRELLRRRDVRIIPRSHARVGGEKTGGARCSQTSSCCSPIAAESPRDELSDCVAALGFEPVDRVAAARAAARSCWCWCAARLSRRIARPRFHLPCGTVRHTNGDEKYRVCLCENP